MACWVLVALFASFPRLALGVSIGRRKDLEGNATSLTNSSSGLYFDYKTLAEPRTGCISVRSSLIEGAGKGLFADCGWSAGLEVEEYRGRRTAEQGFDGFYLWSVPVCSGGQGGKFRRLDDAASMSGCNPKQTVWIDARDESFASSPLRFVNGARTDAQRAHLNVAPYVRDGRLFYFTTRRVEPDEEFLVDYGENYWIAIRAMDKLDIFHKKHVEQMAKQKAPQ